MEEKKPKHFDSVPSFHIFIEKKIKQNGKNLSISLIKSSNKIKLFRYSSVNVTHNITHKRRQHRKVRKRQEQQQQIKDITNEYGTHNTNKNQISLCYLFTSALCAFSWLTETNACLHVGTVFCLIVQ